ncbi:hypothetical protein B0T10DRAFT_590923 [Thelonectria olida]|uniref:Ankyrin repeat protein n=1 Tax=Thelonectria olida TaxID=1576542 RepID=A0A9P8VRA5_9HYPO|nr:hypothetical protein B0T10DRAFT_590923 [Thelonectria olida]
MARLLLDARPLDISSGQTEMTLMIRLRKHFSGRRPTPLIHAEADVARALLNHGADQSIANEDSDTPLCNAVQSHKFETAEVLLASSNCPVSAPDENGRTPLYWALRNSNEKIARKQRVQELDLMSLILMTINGAKRWVETKFYRCWKSFMK